MYVCMYVCVYICMRICVYVGLYVCLYVCHYVPRCDFWYLTTKNRCIACLIAPKMDGCESAGSVRSRAASDAPYSEEHRRRRPRRTTIAIAYVLYRDAAREDP